MNRLVGVFVIWVALAVGCATSGPSRPGRHAEAVVDEAMTSLFPGDAEVLTDAQIGAILSAPAGLSLPTSVAIVHIQHVSAARYWGYGRYASALQPGTRQALDTSLSNVLISSGSVIRADPLPTFLLPETPSVAHLREAAARFRAEAVLVYRSDCQAYERYRMFARSEVKAFCSVEAALLDTRTGIVPLSSSALKDFEVKKSDADANMLETVRRAETTSLDAALAEIGADIGRRLSSVE